MEGGDSALLKRTKIRRPTGRKPAPLINTASRNLMLNYLRKNPEQTTDHQMVPIAIEGYETDLGKIICSETDRAIKPKRRNSISLDPRSLQTTTLTTSQPTPWSPRITQLHHDSSEDAKCKQCQ